MVRPRCHPKAARIRRRRDFLHLQRVGIRRHTAHFVVIRHPSSGQISRLGITASKRIGNAVVRNRIKRLMREVFRHYRARIQPPLDIVVIAKAEAQKLSYAQAAAELRASLPLSRGG